MDGPTVQIGACALRAAMVKVPTQLDCVDVCGTGGDGAHTLNISTAVSFVLAGAGLKVAKHGNRAMSSKAGAADVLEALGVNLALTPEQEAATLERAGIVFLFAQTHHPAMREVAGPRRELGFRTIFNLLGPLSNPAAAGRQLVGVYAPDKLSIVAEALSALGCKSAWVVHGHGGLDEMSLSGPSQIAALHGGKITHLTVSPGDLGLAEAPLDQLRGGDAAFNAAALTALLDGQTGPYRDSVLLNAAAAMVAVEAEPDLRTGLARAQRALETGAARQALAGLISAAGRVS